MPQEEFKAGYWHGLADIARGFAMLVQPCWTTSFAEGYRKAFSTRYRG